MKEQIFMILIGTIGAMSAEMMYDFGVKQRKIVMSSVVILIILMIMGSKFMVMPGAALVSIYLKNLRG